MSNRRVFISSVMDGFNEYRDAARHGIQNSGAIPVLVEDFGSLSVSPRNACLDGVTSCDALVVVVGSRGGWTAPSGKLVVEEEVDEARRIKIPVYVFIQNNVERDKDAQSLVAKLSDYVHGHFRKTFDSPQSLTEAIIQTLASVIERQHLPMNDENVVTSLLLSRPSLVNDVILRFVLRPERQAIIIDEVAIASENFINDLMTTAHNPKIGLLSYAEGKQVDSSIAASKISQIGKGQRNSLRDDTELEFRTDGTILIDTNITGRRQLEGLGHLYFILEVDLITRLTACFAFAASLYELLDPFQRYGRFHCNVALHAVGHRALVKEFHGTSAVTVPSDKTEPVPAFDVPKLLDRNDINNARSLIQDIVSVFHRRIPPRDYFGKLMK